MRYPSDRNCCARPVALKPCAPLLGGHEATDTGLAYAPVSQAHGHHHTFAWAMRQRILGSNTPLCHRRMVTTTQFSVLPCCTAAQTSFVPLQEAFDGAFALAICTSGSPGTNHPPTVPVTGLVSNPRSAGLLSLSGLFLCGLLFLCVCLAHTLSLCVSPFLSLCVSPSSLSQGVFSSFATGGP